jgi:hypothetical protein
MMSAWSEGEINELPGVGMAVMVMQLLLGLVQRLAAVVRNLAPV